MPEATSAPAAAPAAAPSSTPAAAPAAAPSGPPQSSPSPLYAELDALSADDIAPPETPEPEPDTPEGDEPPETPETPETPPAGKGKPPEKPLKAAELRQAYQDLKSKHAQLESELAEVRGKVADPAERERLDQELQQMRQRNEQLEHELKLTNFASSDDYKQNYEKPFVDAYQSGRAKVASMKLVARKNDEGEVTQEARIAQPQDFDAIMQIANDEEAAEMAEQMFGNKAALVLYHRERVLEANQKRLAAIEEYRQKGAERMTKQGEEQKKLAQRLTESFKTLNQQAADKYPQWFKPEEGDERGNQLLQQGFAMADLAFSGNGKLSPDELVKLHSAVRNKAAGFDRLVYRNNQLQRKVKELEKKLGGFKQSTPGKTTAGGRPRATKPQSYEQEIDALVGK